MPNNRRKKNKKDSPVRPPPDPNLPEEEFDPPSDVESVPEPRDETNASTGTTQMTIVLELLLGSIQQLSSDIREGQRETMERTTEKFRELRSGLQDLQDTIVSTMDPTSMAQTLVEEIQRLHTESDEIESARVEPDATPSNEPEEDTSRTDNAPADRTEAPLSLFVHGRYPMYGKDASNNLGKYTKQLQLLPRAKGDDLRSLESLWDAHVNALNASVNSSNVLPAYKDLRQGFDIREYMLGEPNSGLHTSAINTVNMYGNALRTVLLGDGIVTIAHSPKLYDAIQTKSTSMPSNCGFTLLQSAIAKLSPQLGGENTDIRAQIESFRPEDGEELGMYFRRGTGILRDSQLALLPNDSRNCLLRKWLEGLNSDQKFVSYVSDYLRHLKIHEKGTDQSNAFPYTMEIIYNDLTSRSCPTTISLNSVEDQVRLHPVNFGTTTNDSQEFLGTASQARYGRPPSKSKRHPAIRTNQHRQEYQNDPLVEPYIASIHNDDYLPFDEDEYMDFFADPESYLGTIDDCDVDQRVAMVRFGMTSYECRINDEGQELMIEEIPEDTSPTLTQVSTHNLRPSQHLHMDLSSSSVTSVRSMNALMSVSDAKTRYLWTFPTRNKRPPIDICRSIYELLR